MSGKWIVFFVSCVVLVGSLGYARHNDQQEDIFLRGQEMATEQPAMPDRGIGRSIGGVNVELTQYETSEELTRNLQAMADLGLTWVRQTIYWERVEPEKGEWDWSVYEPVIEAVAAHPDLQLIAVLDGTPPWARHHLAPEHPFAPPESVADYTRFVREFARLYHAQVDYYQIWDEPNIKEHWGNLDPRAADYVAMLENAYEAIHDEDGQAMVIAAALAPTVESGPENYSDILYLKAIYDLGGGDSFDAAAGKPYGFDFPPDDRTVDWGVLNFSRIILLREEMLARGDGHKPLWGSNFGWNHLPADWSGPPSRWGQVSAEAQLDYTHQAFDRAEQEWPWMVGLIIQHWQPDVPADDPLQGFAIAPQLDRWQEDGELVTTDILIPGFYVPREEFVTGGNWDFGETGADARFEGDDSIANTMQVTFRGTDFAMRVNRDDYTAYLLLTVDGEHPNRLPINQQDEAFIILTSASRQPSSDLIQVATGLESGQHEATITHYHRMGEDYWSVGGFAVAVQPDIARYERIRWIMRLIALLALAVGGYMAFKLPWNRVRLPSAESLRNAGDLMLTLTISGIFVMGAALSWGDAFTAFLRRDPPALLLTVATVGLSVYMPIVWFGLLALAGFAVIVFNRPVMGLLAVTFWSAFFTTTIDTYFRLFNAVEILLLITALMIVSRWFYEFARFWQQQRDVYESGDGQHPLRQSWEWLTVKFYAHIHLLDILMILFTVLAVISISWADLRTEALRELRAMILGPMVFYFLLRLSVLAKNDLVLVVDAAILGGTAMALFGLYNYATGDVVDAEGIPRLISTYGSPNSAALHLGRTLPFTLAYVLLVQGDWRRIFGSICGAIMLLAGILTQSVGFIAIGLPAAFAVMMLAWQGRRAFIPLAGLAGVAALALVPLSRVIPRLQNLFDTDSATSAFRLNVWRSSWQMIQDYPLRGVGLDQFLYQYRSKYILPEAWEDPDLSHPHNIVLDYWLRLGILGVVMGIAFQAVFWRTALDAYRRLREPGGILFALVLGAMGSMAYFLFHGLIDSAYFAINLSYFFALTLALIHRLSTINPVQ